MEDDRESRQRRLGVIDSETARRIIAQSSSRDELMFTAGEPTLRPDLLSLVRYAGELGFRQIGIITNARRLAYERFAEDLVKAGINYILVSIHGHSRQLHDGLTRTPGSFEQTVQGMKNIRSLRERDLDLKFVTTTVLNRRNMGQVAELVRFLRGFEPNQVVFNCIQPLGRGQRFFTRLVPSYTQLVEAFAAGLEQLDHGLHNLYLLDVPRCVTRNLPNEVLGFVELHRHFEPEGEIMDGLGGEEVAVPTGNGNGMLKLVTKEDLDCILRMKGPMCGECIHNRSCEGVWKAYAREYGFEEFVPVRPNVGEFG